MKRILFLLLMISSAFVAVAQTSATYYYKLTKQKVGGNISTNVSGGQFITFYTGICFDSDKNANAVGNGTMNRTSENGSERTYQGTSYWGSGTTYKFTNNLSELTVLTANGDLYAYSKAIAPSNVTTCSLIAGKSSVPSAGGGGSYTVTPVSSGNGGTSSTKGQCSTCHGSGYVHENVTSQTMCQQCYGRCSCHTCGGKGWTTGMSISDRVPCSVCGQTGRCRNCNGSGKVNKTDYNKSVKCRSCNGIGRK